MATIRRFEDLQVWQKARILCIEVDKHILSKKEPSEALKDQIDRASGSIMDNIAEGFEREGNKEFRQYLSVAKGSCGEVRSQIYRAKDRIYINRNLSFSNRTNRSYI